MKIRFVCWLLLLWSAAVGVASPLAQVSGRKIGPTELGYVESLTISNDGRFFSVLSLPGEKGSDVYIIDRRTHKTRLLPGSGRAEPLCFSRDGRSLWVWGLDLDKPLPGLRAKPSNHQYLALYNLRRERYTRYFPLPDSEDGVVGSSVLSRDGRTLIYSTEHGWVVGVSTRTGKQKWKRRVQNEGDVPVSIELNDDGSKFLRSSDDDNGQAQSAEVVSTRTGHIFSTLRLPFKHPGAMRSAFSRAQLAPRGFQVGVFQSDTQQWVFFNARTAKVQWKMGGPSRTSEGDLTWQWSPDAHLVGVSGPKGFEVRDARSGRVLRTCAALKKSELTFSPDGSRVYALQKNDTGFGPDTVLWQWRLFPTRAQRRADARFMRRLHAHEDRFALSPRHINESLIQAAKRGDLRRVKSLIQHGAQTRKIAALASAVSGVGDTNKPERFIEVAHFLLQQGTPLSAHDGSILADAAASNLAMTKLLLEYGANVNADATGYGLPTALHASVNFGMLDTVRFLLSHGADANARGKDGTTPLLQLSNSSFTGPATNTVAIAAQLISHGANVNTGTTKNSPYLWGTTALHRAVWQFPFADLAKFLLEHGANPNARDSKGQTPLMSLTSWDEAMGDTPDEQRDRVLVENIEQLVKHGANVNMRDLEGHTALSLAKTPAIKAALRKAGAKP